MLDIHVTVDGSTTIHHFDVLPIHFGRDAACDLVLPHPFISRRHGRIEARGDHVVVIDDRSRNGIHRGGFRLPTGVPATLPFAGCELVIDQLSLTIVRTFGAGETQPLADAMKGDTKPLREPPAGAGRDATPAHRPSAETLPAHLVMPDGGEDDIDESRTALYADQRICPRPLDDGLRALDEYRAARTAALDAIRTTVELVDSADRPALVRQLAMAYTDLAHDPALRELASLHGIDVATPVRIEEKVPVSRRLAPFRRWALWKRYVKEYARVSQAKLFALWSGHRAGHLALSPPPSVGAAPNRLV